MSEAAEQFKQDFEDVKQALKIVRQCKSIARDSDDSHESIYWVLDANGTSMRTEDIPARYGGGEYSHYYRKDGSLYGKSIYGEFMPF